MGVAALKSRGISEPVAVAVLASAAIIAAALIYLALLPSVGSPGGEGLKAYAVVSSIPAGGGKLYVVSAGGSVVESSFCADYINIVEIYIYHLPGDPPAVYSVSLITSLDRYSGCEGNGIIADPVSSYSLCRMPIEYMSAGISKITLCIPSVGVKLSDAAGEVLFAIDSDRGRIIAAAR